MDRKDFLSAGPAALLSHGQIWNAIDRLALKRGLTASGLAKLAGLDPTTFNKSKRAAPDGRTRWPSTESLSKVLAATNTSAEEFFALLSGQSGRAGPRIPVIGLAQAGSNGFFDDGGFPTGAGWELVTVPGIEDENAYALEVSGESMAPLYREGDIIIVSPAESVRRNDRVVVKTKAGEVMVKQLTRRTATQLELGSLNPNFPPRILALDDVAWMARIIWASQ